MRLKAWQMAMQMRSASAEAMQLCHVVPRYKARQVLATGSLLLDGPGPGAEGVAGLGRLGLGPIRRAQLFETCEDTSRRHKDIN